MCGVINAWVDSGVWEHVHVWSNQLGAIYLAYRFNLKVTFLQMTL
jgi:hypothetical protein